MKLNMQDNSGVLTITNENPKDGEFEIIIDAQTGVVMDFSFTAGTIDKMQSFMFSARSYHRSYLTKNAIDKFLD
jgi:hypothetical protein